jgi:hypothetical protein
VLSGCDAVDGSSTDAEAPLDRGAVDVPRFGGAEHANDRDDCIATSVFQVHGIDAAGQVVRFCNTPIAKQDASARYALDELLRARPHGITARAV